MSGVRYLPACVLLKEYCTDGSLRIAKIEYRTTEWKLFLEWVTTHGLDPEKIVGSGRVFVIDRDNRQMRYWAHDNSNCSCHERYPCFVWTIEQTEGMTPLPDEVVSRTETLPDWRNVVKQSQILDEIIDFYSR